MTSSPYCSAFKFPAVLGSVHESPDYSPDSSLAALAVSSRLTESHDYFALSGPPHPLPSASTFVSPKKLPVVRVDANSISSVGSDATLVEAPPQPPAASVRSFSTDTLVEDPLDAPMTTLPKPSRKPAPTRGPLSHRAASLSSLSLGSLRLRELAKSTDVYARASHSALDPHFLFHRPLPAETGKGPDLTYSAMMAPPARLKKQATAPHLSAAALATFVESIKMEQSKRSLYQPVQLNMSESIVALSSTMSYEPEADIARRIAHPLLLPDSTLPGVLVIDIRPFTDYARGHVTGSLNVCLPLTLLKRSNFSLQKCINSLPNYEKLVLLNYLHYNDDNCAKNTTFDSGTLGLHGLPPIIVYDNTNSSSNVYHMCKKLIDFSCWNAASAPPVYLMNCPFEAFSKLNPQLISMGKEEPVDLTLLPIATLPETPLPDMMAKLDHSLSAGISILTQERAKSVSGASSLVTPNVCNFVLPADLPDRKFSIRHNEEVFDCIPEQQTLSVSSVPASKHSLLPSWLSDVVTNDDKILADFNKLEKSERIRLNNVLSLRNTGTLMTPGGTVEVSPEISCGLDYGHKNRYKDIFLFNHSRVFLKPAGGRFPSQLDCDYINASYLKPMPNISSYVADGKSFSDLDMDAMRFIATQGPLQETIGDFWKCIVNQKCLLVVSLTNEIENGVHKCSSYWIPGVYFSGHDKLEVQLILQEQSGNFAIRAFEILVNDNSKHSVLQVHLDKWEDMSANVDVKDLLSIVCLKRHVLSRASVKSRYPIIAHCSAGCGRTGVFCAVDSVVSLLNFNDNGYNLPRDPVYDVVNNLRQDRILMVQTMRQYCLIYDALVQYALHEKIYLNLCDLSIVKTFLERI